MSLKTEPWPIGRTTAALFCHAHDVGQACRHLRYEVGSKDEPFFCVRNAVPDSIPENMRPLAAAKGQGCQGAPDFLKLRPDHEGAVAEDPDGKDRR